MTRSSILLISGDLLAVILCALILAVLGAYYRFGYLAGVNSSAVGESPPTPNNGLKKKALQSLPKSTFTASADSPCSSSREGYSSTECAICLTEFSDGNEMVDLYVVVSCPSCRRIMVPVKCDRCGHHASTAETRIEDQLPPHQHPSQFTSAVILP